MSLKIGEMNREQFLAQLLYECVEDNRLDAVHFLLQKGANPNAILPKKGISPFHLAVGCERIFALQATNLMLKYGGDPNVRSEDGLTPVHITAAWGNLEILHALLSSGGDRTARDENRMSPIDYARKEEQWMCLKLLERFIPAAVMVEPCVKLDSSEKTGLETTDLDKIGLEKTGLDKTGLEKTGLEKIGLERTGLDEGNAPEVKGNLDLSLRQNRDYVESWVEKHSTHHNNNSSTDEKVGTTQLNPVSVFKTPIRQQSDAPLDVSSSTSVISDSSIHSSFINSESKPFSMESGVVVLSNSFESPICNTGNSYYVSCAENAPSTKPSDTDDLSFVTVLSEVIKHEDKEENVILYEQRLVLNPSERGESPISDRCSSKMSSVPDTFVYDIDTLKKELTLHGYQPGPITATTKRVYLKKLYNLKRKPAKSPKVEEPSRVYSLEMEKTKHTVNWYEKNLELYKSLEESMSKDFSQPNPAKKWREGLAKASFNYILLDPRITNNLPCRAETLDKREIWEIFLSAVFYVGKGKKSRPYSHLYDAVALWKHEKYESANKKLNYILDIWKDKTGVICLHLFHNVIPAEAFTREAAMISALNLNNVTNLKSGEFYGSSVSWSQKHKNIFGTYLLYKAMNIFLNDGERQLYPCDVD